MESNSNTMSRRGFLGAAAATALLPVLAACTGNAAGGSSGGTSGVVKFWDMPWGTPAYNEAAKKLTAAYVPASGHLDATYQTIQWNNFYQTFSSAIASNTGPAVSTGGGFQAFQFDQQGAIAYADGALELMKKNGVYNDFLPGILEPFKSSNGYVAVPWGIDLRVNWYRKSLFERAGVPVPSDWPSLLAAGQAFKKMGITGFNTGAGAGNFIGNHAMLAFMINNGGGVFDTDGHLDVMNDRNVEATEFLLELVSQGIIDPAAVSFNQDAMDSQWKNKKTAYGLYALNVDKRVGDTSGDLAIASPLVGPRGDKSTLMFLNNIMMYKNNPSQASTDAFLAYYMSSLKDLWKQKLVQLAPVLQSVVALPEFSGDPNNAIAIKEYYPNGKTFAAQGNKLNADLAVLDGGQALNEFTQTILTGKTDAKTALKTFQTGLQSVIKQA